MWLLAVLTVFFNKKMYGCSARLKKSGHNNEVTIIAKVATRQGSTVVRIKKNTNQWMTTSIHSASQNRDPFISKNCQGTSQCLTTGTIHVHITIIHRSGGG